MIVSEEMMREEYIVNSNRKTAIFIGVLYLVVFAVGILSVVYVIEEPDYLTVVSKNANQVLFGAFFQLFMAPAYVAIALLFYPILRKYNDALALGFVGFRFIAAAFHMIGVVSLPLFLRLSQEFIKAGSPDMSHFQTFGELLRLGRDMSNHVGMILALSFGGLLLYYIMYQLSLVPRWLSVWGLVGSTLTILASLMFMFQLISLITPVYLVLNIPMALQEVTLALWLIIKGFNSKIEDLYA